MTLKIDKPRKPIKGEKSFLFTGLSAVPDKGKIAEEDWMRDLIQSILRQDKEEDAVDYYYSEESIINNYYSDNTQIVGDFGIDETLYGNVYWLDVVPTDFLVTVC
tara:strand:+ start:8630 stop:8944 length:315 start_codon:yes stop_codon:yes gene_type:complete